MSMQFVLMHVQENDAAVVSQEIPPPEVLKEIAAINPAMQRQRVPRDTRKKKGKCKAKGKKGKNMLRILRKKTQLKIQLMVTQAAIQTQMLHHQEIGAGDGRRRRQSQRRSHWNGRQRRKRPTKKRPKGLGQKGRRNQKRMWRRKQRRV